MSTANQKLLDVQDLSVHFKTGNGILRAVDGVSFHVNRGETLGLVGESGCGKSTTARAILRLEPLTGGKVFFDGEDITTYTGNRLRETYRKIQIIFQDPYASLNPRMTAGHVVAEPLVNFGLMSGAELEDRVKELFRQVGLDPRFINRYPHEFSGGQRQRIGIARALALNPSLIICDEPVSALDVSIRSQIINLLEELQSKFAFSYIFISHDLSVVKHVSSRVAVMYLGKIVEMAHGARIYTNPAHPYTKALLSAIPIPDPEIEKQRRRMILGGDAFLAGDTSIACKFISRCPDRFAPCSSSHPGLVEISPGHFAACHRLSGQS